MSTTTSPKKTIVSSAEEPRPAPAEQAPSVWREFFDGLASLKLTVWLFALSIILVFAGTLAQVDKEIWQVMDEYFRTFITRIDFQLFFPRSFFPSGPQVSGGVYFPGGWLLGVLLAVNLVVAHGVRFRPQARGRRLATGILLIAAGVGLTWLVIAGDSASEGLPAAPWLGWGTLWKLFLLGLAGVWGVLIVALMKFDGGRRHERRILAIAAVLLAGLLGWLITQPEAGRLDNSSMRILWQLTKGSASGLVLLAGCVLVFRKRAGIVLLHGGIALLMFNELLVGLTTVEGRMNISEGQTINYVEDARRLELAVVDKSNRDYDDVVVIPQAMLSRETTIRHPDLPFDVRVEAFYKNAELQPVMPDAPNPATAGLGLNWRANEVRPVSATEAREKGDNFAAYVTLLNKKNAESLGTYLVSRIQTAAELPEIVKVDARPYKLYLRHTRIYKPYQIRLIDVKKEDYLGANTPRHFASQVQLVDKTRAVDQTVNIWMNNPLRYAGETFYQSNYFRDPETGVESTTLQVVTNAGWMIPYVACMIVATGMLAHFLFVLLRFLDRRAREQSSPAPFTANDSLPPLPLLQNRRRWTAWALPACIVLACGAWIGWESLPPRQPNEQFKLYNFGKLPVVFQGRVQPIDTLARNALLVMSQRQDFVDAAGQRQPAVRWLLDVIARPEAAAAHKVFRIEHPELLATLGLEPRAGFRYAPAEFQSQRENLRRQARVAQARDVALLSVYQKKVVELGNKLALYELLVDSFQTPVVRNDPLTKELDLRVAAQRADLLAQRTPPLVIPVVEGEQTWISYPAAWLENARRPEGSTESETSFVASLGAIRAAYVADDVERFNTEVDAYLASVGQLPSSTLDVGKVRFEAFFNHCAPFYHAAVLYVFAFVLAAASWLGWTRPLNRAAFWLIVLTFVVHSLALAARIVISGRPPVTNLYSSAIFIGWGAVLLGLVIEMVYRMGIGNVAASVAGFATLLIAHFLAGNGDTLAVLQAVLDTQFWLATHVVCITLGYTTTLMVGVLGVLYILWGLTTPTLKPHASRALSRMIYGMLCFATFFSFVGTVLGGLWADDSWGRFWGWDPKENGALIIVLWNALTLHARWGKLVNERGLAVLAVAGNIAVTWSWFGVNELGVGLHSYGFTEGTLRALAIFVASQLAIVGLGLMPEKWWWSNRRQSAAQPPMSA